MVKVGNVEIGGKRLVIMAGPCAVESKKQLEEATRIVKNAGASVLRGGAFKPRTSPFSFQGLERTGLEYLAEVKKKYQYPDSHRSRRPASGGSW